MDGPVIKLFAEFYYRDVSAPEYCRYYSRNNHAFKMHGKTCLKSNGRWKLNDKKLNYNRSYNLVDLCYGIQTIF